MRFLPDDVVARRLRVRGFRDITAEEACRIGPWMCFTPVLQAILFGVCTLTASVLGFRLLGILLLVGAVAGRHPLDWIYDGVIRHIEDSPRLPPTPMRRRAVFVVGAALCLATALLFARGHAVAGYALGVVVTLSTTLLAFTHVCIPSRVLAWISERGKREAGGA